MPLVKSEKIKSAPLISAVIAAYNEELHLAACIDSLLAQSYLKLEIIIVENGESRDKTFEIAKKYEKKDKRVRAFSLPGKQKGPGNAWNFGIKKSKGTIVMICGADLIYGKNYIIEGIKPIIEGKTVGINHAEEKCNNPQNLWARAFFYKRSSFNFFDSNSRKTGLSRVFSLIRKDYVEKRLFNSELGYADDQTIFQTEGTEFLPVNLEVYHTNPTDFIDTWNHNRWVGRSLKRHWPIILVLPVFPFYAVYRSLKHMITEDFYPPFILFLPVYYSIRYFAYFTEAVKKCFD